MRGEREGGRESLVSSLIIVDCKIHGIIFEHYIISIALKHVLEKGVSQ